LKNPDKKRKKQKKKKKDENDAKTTNFNTIYNRKTVIPK
jgi:hypothetical protein